MASPIDVYVGSRVRALRKSAGLTQTQLARRCGVKFQQVQKYETGANRVSASRMVMLARVLDVPITEIFGKYSGGASYSASVDDAAFRGRWVGRLVRGVSLLDDNARASVFALVGALVKSARPRARGVPRSRGVSRSRSRSR